MKILLWVDNIKNPYNNDYINDNFIKQDWKVIWTKSYKETIDFLENNWPNGIFIDYDLGEEKTGYDIAKYIVDKCISNNYKLPHYASQSNNPVGRKNIIDLFRNFDKFNKI